MTVSMPAQPMLAVAKRNQKLGPQYVGISEPFACFSKETLTSILYDSLSTQSLRVIMRHKDEAGVEFVIQSEKVIIPEVPGCPAPVVYSLIHAIRCDLPGDARLANLDEYRENLQITVRRNMPVSDFLHKACAGPLNTPVAAART